jgi:hypothetical protein
MLQPVAFRLGMQQAQPSVSQAPTRARDIRYSRKQYLAARLGFISTRNGA